MPDVDVVAAQFGDATAADGYAAAHEGWGPSARYYLSRLHAVRESLRVCAGGDLLDVGCGPGMLLRELLDTRPGEFHITACDRSPAMVHAAAERVGTDARVLVASIEELPFPDASFDIVLALGVLEYVDVGRALRELARVVRPGGRIVVTMLNPLSPYRMFEWTVYWPALRMLGWAEELLGKPAKHRHGARRTGIRALPAPRLGRLMADAGLRPQDVIYYDLTPTVPPFDRLARRWNRRWRHRPERTLSRGALRWLGTAYLMAATPGERT